MITRTKSVVAVPAAQRQSRERRRQRRRRKERPSPEGENTPREPSKATILDLGRRSQRPASDSDEKDANRKHPVTPPGNRRPRVDIHV